MKKRFLIFLLFFSFLLLPKKVLADGLIVPPPGYWIEETEQKAVIFHEENQETLIISVTFQGDAEDFAWLIPLPTRPEVDKSTDEVFVALQELTQPPFAILERKGIDAVPLGAGEEGVTVWETKKVDIYEIAVLTSTDKKSLTTWLNDNGYQYPTSQAYILEEYINMGWYFVATKVNTESLGKLTEAQLREGHAAPLKMTFETEKPLYPLKISSVMSDFTNIAGVQAAPLVYEESSEEGMEPRREIAIAPRPPRRAGVEVLLYIFSDHKSYLPGFSTVYAGWLKKDKIENLAQIQGEPWLETDKGKYLTRLQRNFTVAEMNNDLWIRAADDDEVVGSGEPKSGLLTKEKRLLLILGIPLVLEVLVILIILVVKKGRKNEP